MFLHIILMNLILIFIGKQIGGDTKDKGPVLEANGFKQVYDLYNTATDRRCDDFSAGSWP